MSRQVTMTTAEFRALQQTGTLDRYVQQQDETEDSPEAILLAYIRTLAKQHSWEGWHCYNPEGKDQGLHTMLARPKTTTSRGRLIYAEIKSRGAKLTPWQDTWISILQHSIENIEVYCWRPSDMKIIKDILTQK